MAKLNYNLYKPWCERLRRILKEDSDMAEAYKKAYRRVHKSSYPSSRVITDMAAVAMAFRQAVINRGYYDAVYASAKYAISNPLLFDEIRWTKTGNYTVFTKEGLLESLHIPELNLTSDNIRLPRTSFAIATKRGTSINGINIPALFVAIRSLSEAINGYRRIFDKMVGVLPSSIKERLDDVAGDSWESEVIHTTRRDLTMWCSPDANKDTRFVSVWYYDQEEGIRSVGLYPDRMKELITEDVGDRDGYIARLVVLALAYMGAFPDSVEPGFPDDLYIGKSQKRFTPSSSIVIGGQHSFKDRESAEGHWRSEHFRRYPLRPDGTRKEGLIPVSGCLVNLPETAETAHPQKSDSSVYD